MNSVTTLSVLTLVLWSLGGVCARLFNVGGGIWLYSIFIAAAMFSYLLMIFYQQKRFYLPTVKEIFSKNGLISTLGYGFYWLLISEAVRYADNASLPFTIQYIWVIANAIFFETVFSEGGNKKLSVYSLILTVISLFGVMLLSAASGIAEKSLPLICLFSVAAGICYGYFSAYTSTIKREKQPEFLALSSITGLLVMISWAILTSADLNKIGFNQIVYAFILGALVDGLGSYLWARANRLVRERGQTIYIITSIPLFLPFSCCFLLYIFFAEYNIFSADFILGLSVVIFSALLIRERSGNN